MKRVKNILLNYGTVLAFIIVIIIFSSLSEQFFTLSNLRNILDQTAMVAVVSIGLTFVIISGGIDISVGSSLFFSALISTIIYKHLNIHPVLFLILTIIIPALVGLLNGVIIAKLKILPIIATLATLSIFRGLGYLGFAFFAPEYWVRAPIDIMFLGSGRLLGIPYSVIIMIVCVIIAIIILNLTKFGHYIVAIGNNINTAKISGIKLDRILILNYMLCGIFVGISTLMWITHNVEVKAAAGENLEFLAITAVILGGTSMYGGEGGILKTIFGALFIVTINAGITILGFSPYWYTFTTGSVILFAIFIDSMKYRFISESRLST